MRKIMYFQKSMNNLNENINNSRLTPELRRQLFNRFKETGNKKAIAREFRIDPKTVRNVIKRFENYGIFKDLS